MTSPPSSPTVSTAGRLRDAGDRFTVCLARLLGHEGGFNDLAADRGGATNWGISLRFLRAEVAINAHVRALFPRGPVTVHTIRALTRDQAATIYLWCFWLPAQCDRLPPPVDGMMFDQAVNAGVRTAARLLQRAVNRAGVPGVRLIEDGQIGPRTIAAAAAVPADAMRAAFRVVAESRYRALVDADPSQRVFLGGWLARARALGDV